MKRQISGWGAVACVMIFGIASLVYAQAAPKLSPAEEKLVRRVQCEDNLHRIGMAISLYSNDNGGKAPPSLGTLATTGMLDLPVFICPSTPNSVPADWKAMPPAEQAKWVNAHTDYVYVAANKDVMDLMSNPDAALAYDRDDDHGKDGMNVLYADAHVEFLPLAVAKKKLGASAGSERTTTRVAPVAGKSVSVPLISLQEVKVMVAKSDRNTLMTAITAFEVDMGRYPTATEGLAVLLHKPTADAGKWKGPYLEKLLQDPWGHAYLYTAPSANAAEPSLISPGPDGKRGTADDVK